MNRFESDLFNILVETTSGGRDGIMKGITKAYDEAKITYNDLSNITAKDKDGRVYSEIYDKLLTNMTMVLLTLEHIPENILEAYNRVAMCDMLISLSEDYDMVGLETPTHKSSKEGNYKYKMSGNLGELKKYFFNYYKALEALKWIMSKGKITKSSVQSAKDSIANIIAAIEKLSDLNIVYANGIPAKKTGTKNKGKEVVAQKADYKLHSGGDENPIFDYEDFEDYDAGILNDVDIEDMPTRVAM
jgi:hypothetical protein